jgi:hypothetical protein
MSPPGRLFFVRVFLWPDFGRTGVGGRIVEAVGVFIHVAGVQVPVQVEGGRDARMAEDRLQHLGRVTGLDHEGGGGVPQVVNAEPVADPGQLARGEEHEFQKPERAE